MDKTEILYRLELQKYNIRYKEQCDCSFSWEIKEGDLTCSVEKGDKCGVTARLTMGKFLIAQYKKGELITYHNILEADLPKLVVYFLSYDTINMEHKRRLHASLVSFIISNGLIPVRYKGENSFQMIMGLVKLPRFNLVSLDKAEDWAWDFINRDSPLLPQIYFEYGDLT